jgi:hypothetical protein
LVGLHHFTVPRAISISQVTIRGDVILIGDLVAKATTELYIVKHTHALSEPAFTTALEVLAANDDSNGGYTPTPPVERRLIVILAFARRLADLHLRAGDFLVRNGAQDMLDPIYACAPFVF